MQRDCEVICQKKSTKSKVKGIEREDRTHNTAQKSKGKNMETRVKTQMQKGKEREREKQLQRKK
jgi:hypothetical protein